MPKQYFQTDCFDKATNISGASVAETILAGVSACHACVIACGRVVRLEDGQKRKGPEYETLVGFGPNLGLVDPKFATRMGELCDRYGMDSISLSNTLGLAFKLFELDLITERDTGGFALRWGDVGVVERLVHWTARQESFGAYLAEGARALASRFGAEDLAVQVNGLEVPYHDPRGASGMALVYATSPRGACHNQSDYFMVDVGQAESSLGLEFLSRHAGADKARNVARHQDWRTLFNSLVMCYFSNISPEMVIALINAACGLDWDIAQALDAGERGWNLKRLINIRLGLRRENDHAQSFAIALPTRGRV
jgi:aldehyde:ferredoxin oxidoreductase